MCQARIGTRSSSSDTFYQVRRPPPAAGGAWARAWRETSAVAMKFCLPADLSGVALAKTEVFTKAGLLVGFMVVFFRWSIGWSFQFRHKA